MKTLIKRFLNVDIASEHFQSLGNDMVLLPGERDYLDYSKNACLLGDSFVSRSESSSGWGYETRNEVDGFLISIPDAGRVHWTNRQSSFTVTAGELSVVDQREVIASRYDAMARYTTVYIANIDVFRTLSLLNGKPPKAPFFFRHNKGAPWTARCMVNFVETIIESWAHAQSPTDGVIKGLKEAMITFALYTLENNYSCALLDDHTITSPTPHVIKFAAEYMIESSNLNLTVGDIAVYAGISSRSLQTGFKKFKGTTPIAFLRTVRLERARDMLTDTSSTSTPREISIRCGFSNFYLFSKYYMESYGESPASTFRKKLSSSTL
ncbi:helix-turn-helix domain-containing protein [Pseudomonas syringae pv. syringae]|uniref:helix-turn-helix transcriptional regulator n=1 Tax=Pseudomonas syringae TaxID=317 RepID=UPI000CDA0331|nr:helix-turn-helix transcriptional regulator [Pseudomonas syringae]POP65142.1 AraC family transcriptional regulator [Pseudomonas syringae]